MILRDGIVDKVDKRIVIHQAVIIFAGCKPEVGLIPSVNCQWVPVHDKDPLADIKFVPMDQLRVLDVLLADPLLLFPRCLLENPLQVTRKCDAPSAALTSRLHDPSILRAVQRKLRKSRLQLPHHTLDLRDHPLPLRILIRVKRRAQDRGCWVLSQLLHSCQCLLLLLRWLFLLRLLLLTHLRSQLLFLSLRRMDPLQIPCKMVLQLF
mmetsp:Transcript_54207/g.118798  ORF Transcript_54207/g.118798 Transcript_54207/m.118798 type:complete len:208 (+) Transcript_54207:1040-1663(+)